MSTHAIIGIRTFDSKSDNGGFTIMAIYCHYDGYDEGRGVGPVLREHYTDEAKVQELIALGDLKSLGSEIGEAHTTGSTGTEHMCNAFGRDDGGHYPGSLPAIRLRSVETFLDYGKEQGAEYAYLFRPETRSWQTYTIPFCL